MSNYHASKQHGLTKIKITSPKSKLRKRFNKAKATVRKADRRKALSEVMFAK